jgi:hypothetical protein
MTTSLVIISCLVGGATGLIAGIKHQLAGTHLILAVAGAILGSIILTYVAILALKILIVAALIVGIYYAVQWVRAVLGK